MNGEIFDCLKREGTLNTLLKYGLHANPRQFLNPYPSSLRVVINTPGEKTPSVFPRGVGTTSRKLVPGCGA